ncbi:MAG: YabP/YqfC family sporulation protein [Bacilli bacterium]
MFKRLSGYINNKEFKINIYNNLINIDNYDEIVTLTDNLIIIRYDKNYVYIKGNNLSIRRLLDNELLIDGNIGAINFNDK